MTAAARIAAAAVLVIAGSLAMLWAGTGTGGPAGMVRVLVMAAAVAAVVLALSALLPPNDGAYPEDWREQGWCCRECAVTAWYGMSLELRRELLASMTAGGGSDG